MPHGTVAAWRPARLPVSANRVPHGVHSLGIVFQNNARNRAAERQNGHLENVIRKDEGGPALEVFVTQELPVSAIRGAATDYQTSQDGCEK